MDSWVESRTNWTLLRRRQKTGARTMDVSGLLETGDTLWESRGREMESERTPERGVDCGAVGWIERSGLERGWTVM